MPKASWMDSEEKFVYRTSTGTVITPYKTNFCPSLERRYSIKKYDRAFPLPYCGFYLAKDHVFVCPPDLPAQQIVSEYLPDYKAIDLIPNVGKATVPFHAGVDHLRLAQEIYIKEAKQAVANGHTRIFCNMQTGYGKTVAAVLMMHHHQLKTCIITYINRLFKQWVDTILGMTDISPDQIFQIKGSKSINKILEDPFRYNQYDVFLISHETLTSYGTTYGYSRISELFEALGIGVKIYDEAHHSIRSMICIDSFTNVPHTYYLSADFNQANDEKSRKFKMIFKGVPVLPSVGKGERYVTCLSMIYDSVPQMHEILAINQQSGFNLRAFMRYQFKKNYVLDCVDSILDRLMDSNKFVSTSRILILTTFVEDVYRIYEHVKVRYGFNLGEVGLYHGTLPAEDKERTTQNARVIVATYSSFGVGLDIPNIQCVISCDPISRITANQAAGRVRPSEDPHKYALFVMLSDYGFSYCKHNHQKNIDYLKAGKGLHFINYWITA